MDHTEALRQQAAEKYALGELPDPLREQYEEHFFDCAECALDVRAAVTFVDGSKEVFREKPETFLETDRGRLRDGWFGWFRPLVFVPAFAVLLAVVGYQNLITLPRAKEGASRGGAQLFVSSFSLQRANTRGESGVKVQVFPNESFALDFDFTPSRLFNSYIGQLQDEAGRSLLQVSIAGETANKEAHLVIPGGLLHPGKYDLVFAGDPETKGQMTKENEVARLSFIVAFNP
jgi:hypothetical protein